MRIIIKKLITLQQIIASFKETTIAMVDVITLKMARKPVKLQKESPAGCAGEGKQSEGN